MAKTKIEAERELAEVQHAIDERCDARRLEWLRLARDWMPPAECNDMLRRLTSDDPYLRSLLERKWELRDYAEDDPSEP